MVRLSKKRRLDNKPRYNLVFDTLVYAIVIGVFLVTLIPIMYVVSVSLTPYSEIVKNGGFVLIPKSVTFDAYKEIFNDSELWNGMWMTIKITAVGTIANLVVTTLMAYPLSRTGLPGKSTIMKLLVFTMIFSAGTIPTYLVVKGTGLLNTFWAYIIPSLMGVHRLVIMKSFFENLPEEIFEAARIDGCSEMNVLLRVVLPMSIPILLTIGMYYAVGHWNTYMAAVLYITDDALQPMQVLLRRILNAANTNDFSSDTVIPTDAVRNAAVCFCTLPIVVIYPFIQKHFVKGTLAGAVKG